MDDLEQRVQQYNLHELPGQPMATHMGTSYLINDLWRERQKLREELSQYQKVTDLNKQLVAGVMEENTQLRDALKEAIETIKAWHNTEHRFAGRLSIEEANRMWELYQQSPEMQRINAVLK